MRLSAFVQGIGVLGPGLERWPAARAILRGETPYAPAASVLPTPTILSAVERRRSGRVVKLAVGVALEATQHARCEPAQLASVFSSSGGDGYNCHEICEVLASPQRELSPTRFANSVHNAAAGYWSIATGATGAATVLCAYDASFGAGLLEALTQVAVDDESLLLVSYDAEYPQPMHAKRPVPDAFGVALVLTAEPGASPIARLSLDLTQDAAEHMPEPALETLRTQVPAARCLPLLRQLCTPRPTRSVLDYLDVARLCVDVEPCR